MVIRLGMMQHTITGWLPQLYYVHSIRLDITQVLQSSNPHIEYFNSATHGYNLVEVTQDALTCTLKAVSDITQPGGTLSTLKAYRVPRDQVLIQDITTQ